MENERSNETDPFAKRNGHILAWRNVNVSDNQQGEIKPILQDVSGSIRPGHLCTIMGHSGAGKSTLLNVLAGRIRSTGTTSVSSELLMDEIPIDPLDITVKRKIAYVPQNDTFMASDTPREAIKFSARLRLPQSVTDAEIEVLCKRILKELSLEDVADNYIGGHLFRGLSGGEMRRLSLGIELVVRPSILFLDEVTSGLDSHSARKVFTLCQEIARAGASVIMTIHQPSSQMHAMMDHLVLLHHGRVLYQGQARDLPRYFADRGYPVPRNHNPSDHMVDVAQTYSVEELDAAGFYRDFPTDEVADWERASTFRASLLQHGSLNLNRISMLQRSSKRVELDDQRVNRLSIIMKDSNSHVGPWREYVEVLKREIRYIGRDNDGLMLRFGAVIGASALIAILFAGVGNSPSFTSRVGALYTLVFAMSIGVQFPFLDLVNQRLLFVKEFSSNHFRVPAYSAAKVTREFVEGFVQTMILTLIIYWALDLSGNFGIFYAILYTFGATSVALGSLIAAWSPDPRSANEYLPYLILPQLLLAGFLVSDFPSWMEWSKYANPFTYAFRLSLNNEFGSCMDFTEEEYYRYECAKGILDLSKRPDERYDEASVYTLPYTGTYIGAESIVEYEDLLSGFKNPSGLSWDTCSVKGSTVMKFHQANKDYCEFTSSRVVQGRFNPLIMKDSLWEGYSSPEEGPTWLQVMLGQRVTVSNNNRGPNPVVIRNISVIFPPALIDFYSEFIDPEKISRTTCGILFNSCPEEVLNMEKQVYSTVEECVEKFMSLPISTVNEEGRERSPDGNSTLQEGYMDGNSTGCRGYHHFLSVGRPQEHCPHISFLPMEDPNGKNKCHISSFLQAEDFFEPIDFRLFEYAMDRTGLFEDSDFWTGQLATRLLPEDLSECSDGVVPDPNALIGSHVFPDGFECASYLELQGAEGGNNEVYWGVLVAMMIIFRIVAVIGLRHQVSNTTPGLLRQTSKKVVAKFIPNQPTFRYADEVFTEPQES